MNSGLASTVWAHVFLCMLAYYVEWHMRERLKPLLFDDDDAAAAAAARASIVAPAEVSPSAKNKAQRKRNASGWPVHSFRTLLDDLATIAKNRVAARLSGAEPFEVVTRPTVRRALTLASRCRRKYRRTRSRSGATHNAPITLTLRCERVRWRMMGVVPRGAQPRRTNGAIKNADSSMKTSQAFRRAAFFLPGAIRI